MDHDEFLRMVERAAGTNREQAEAAVRATLMTLAERISGGEAEEIAGQLPTELRPLLAATGHAKPFGADDFVRRVAAREGGVAPEIAERHVRAVFATLARAVRAGELADVVAQLSKDYRRLLAAAKPPRQAPAEAQRAIRAEDFVEHVQQRAGLDPDQARRATNAVLEALADRISGGEVDDLEDELPQELHEPLERGKAESNGAARPLSEKEFVLGVAEREGVSPEQATEHARAVFATLREAVSEKEFSDIAAQLSDDYRALLARP
jgi:uncharacterized protein (DUF2267 family)